MLSVRGIGVAVSVSMSTSARICLRRSLWPTPKRCSSSTTTSPRSWNDTSRCSSRCVPITMSTVPALRPSTTARCSGPVRKRDRFSTRTGQSAKRSAKVWACCCASRVVGTSTATCRPPATAANAARSATSVLPKPTSPQTTRSIGLPERMSASTASIASCWSIVSSNGNAASKARYAFSSNAMRPAFAGGAARVEVEQFRGDVAHALGRAAARARPLLGAELVPGRRFGRAAGVAGDAVERVHRHVKQVAAGVLQHQELRRMAGDLHDLQAAIASDAVVLVHHRRAGRERGELAQDRLGIALRPTAPAFLAGALAEQLLLGHEREARGPAGRSRVRRGRRRARAHCRSSRNDGQSAITSTVRPWRRSMSSRTSRRPAESAVTSARPANPARKAASFSSGCDSRLSLRSSGGGPEAKFSNGSVAPIGSTLTAVSVDARDAGRWRRARRRAARRIRPEAAAGRSRSCRRSS